MIDPIHGTPCQVAYALSKRPDPEDTIRNLRLREQTTRKNIGWVFSDGSDSHARDEASREAIAEWVKASKIDVAVWTDLPSKFWGVRGEPFGIGAAVRYVQGLSDEGKAKAGEYIWRAPAFVDTPLRRALRKQQWLPRPANW